MAAAEDHTDHAADHRKTETEYQMWTTDDWAITVWFHEFQFLLQNLDDQC